jgi:hypothetical protein
MLDKRDQSWLEHNTGREGLLFHRLSIASTALCFVFGIAYMAISLWAGDKLGVSPAELASLCASKLQVDRTYPGALLIAMEAMKTSLLCIGGALLLLCVTMTRGRDIRRCERLIDTLKRAGAWPD